MDDDATYGSVEPVLRTHMVTGGGAECSPWSILIGALVAALLIAMAIAGYHYWKGHKSGFAPCCGAAVGGSSGGSGGLAA